jgi:hypothetical protein
MLNKIYSNFFIRLYGFTIAQLTELDFMDVCIIPHIENVMNSSTNGIVRKTVRNGVAFIIAEKAFDYFFDYITDEFNKYSLHNIEVINDIWYAWECSGYWAEYNCDLFGKSDAKAEKFAYFLHKFDNTENVDEKVDMEVTEGMKYLCLIVSLAEQNKNLYKKVRSLYASEIGDRLIHDRQISAFIAGEMLKLAPEIDVENNRIIQFIKRAEWPSFVKEVLIARDRGKCALCGIDISLVLLATAHIDHIYPLSRGGCNDLVNLQLSCSKCNLEKGSSQREARTSVPEYHSRQHLNLTRRRTPKKQRAQRED